MWLSDVIELNRVYVVPQMLKTKSGGAKRKMHNTVMQQLGIVPEERDDQLTTELKRGGFASNGPRKGYFRHACYLGGVCVYS